MLYRGEQKIIGDHGFPEQVTIAGKRQRRVCNGETLDREGNIRPLTPRRFKSLSEAEEENGQSRIYLGIHWSFDKREGIAQGRRVADHVFNHAFLRVH